MRIKHSMFINDHHKMKKAIFLSKPCVLMLFTLMLSNFNAFAQKTTIWIVNHAEELKNGDELSGIGQERAIDLMKALKHEHITIIYTTNKNVSAQTASALETKNTISPMIYSDSLQKLADKIKTTYAGKNILIIADNATIPHIISAFGASSPYQSLGKGDYDQLYNITIKAKGDPESAVRYYGKTHHVTAIPQSYLIDNFSQGVPGH